MHHDVRTIGNVVVTFPFQDDSFPAAVNQRPLLRFYIPFGSLSLQGRVRKIPICVSRVWCVSFDNICIALTWGLDERRAILLTNLSPRSESAFPPLSTIFVYCSNRSTNRCFFSLCIGFRVHSYALLLPMFLFNGPRVSQSLFLTHSWLKTRVLAQFRPHCHSNEATCL